MGPFTEHGAFFARCRGRLNSSMSASPPVLDSGIDSSTAGGTPCIAGRHGATRHELAPVLHRIPVSSDLNDGDRCVGLSTIPFNHFWLLRTFESQGCKTESSLSTSQ